MKRVVSHKPAGAALAVVLLAALVLFLSFGCAKKTSKHPLATEGQLDLRAWNPAAGSHRLDGKWDFYWKKFVDPAQVSLEGSPVRVSVPGVWNRNEVGGEKTGGDGYASYRLNVLMPRFNGRLGIKCADQSSAFELFINGKKIGSAGRPGSEPDGYIPFYQPMDEYFSFAGGDLDICIHVANFNHRKGGLWNPFYIGTEGDIRARVSEKSARDWFLFGSLMVMGFYLFGLFMLRREEKAPLFLCLVFLIFAFKTLHYVDIAFFSSWHIINFEINRKLTYLVHFFPMLFITLFIASVFTADFPKVIKKLAVTVMLLLSLVVVMAPSSVFSYTMPVFQVSAVLLLLLIILILVNAMRKHREGSFVMLVGFIAILVTGINDILYSNHILHTGQFLEVGMFVMVLSQSYLLSIRFMNSFGRIENLSNQLIVQSKELESLNEELVSKNSELDRDIEIRIETEKTLKETWDYLHRIFNSISSILISLNSKGEITEMNRQALNMGKLTLDMALNRKVISVFPFLKPFAEDIDEVIRTGRTRKYDSIVLNPGIDSMTVQMSVSPVSFAGTTGAVISIDDVTELARKREELKQAQKMETIGNLAGGMAHDFNNILAGIIGAVSLLKTSCFDDNLNEERASENIQFIEDASIRASGLVEQLLSLSRKHEIHLEPIDLNRVVAQVVKLLKNTIDKSIAIKENYADIPAIVEADSIQLGQVILNICINASHAMTIMRTESDPYGGELVLNIIKEENSTISRDSDGNILTGGPWIIEIIDTGVGIAPEVISRIFDPFFSTKQLVGTGLGLAISYNIIESFKGLIEVESAPGEGTSFRIVIPVCEDTEAVSKEPEEKVKIFKGVGTVLIIEDEDMVRLTTEKFIKRFGYETLTASGGREGIELFKEKRNTVSLVLLDMVMPGISGLDVFRELLKIDPDVSVLLTSGFHGDERVREAISLGVKGFIQKPYTMEALSKKLSELIK